MIRQLVPRNGFDVVSAARTVAAARAFVVDYFLLLPIGVLIALVWANTAGES